MNLHYILWIFIYGSLLQCRYASSPEVVTPSDSFVLNVVEDSSTSANSETLLETTILNSSNSFSLNNVNTESLHSSLESEECKNSDCTKHVHISSSSDNSSSSASKILWNLVSSTKSTTESPVSEETNSEEITVPLSFPVNAYSSNNSIVNDTTSFYSNDNELDSEINADNNLLEVDDIRTDKVTYNPHYDDNYHNFTHTSTESGIMTTEILLNEVENSDENSSLAWEGAAMHQETFFYGQNNTSVTLNVTEFTTTPKAEENTAYTDNELDFTTYYLDASETNDSDNASLHNKNNDFKHYFSQNSTTEIPYYDSEPVPENDNSSTLNYHTFVQSDELKSKSTDAFNNESSELRTSSYDDSTSSNFEHSDSNTSDFPDYETSLEMEELKSKISRMIDIVDMKNDTSISPWLSDVSTIDWSSERESFTTQTNSVDFSSVTTETPTDHLMLGLTLTSEKYDTVTENKQSNEELSAESTASSFFIPSTKILWHEMTNNDSLENTDSTETSEIILTQEEVRTKTPTSLSNLFNETYTMSTNQLHTEIKDTTDLNSNHSERTGTYSTSATYSSPNDDNDHTENYHSFSPDISASEVMIKNSSAFDSNTESENTRITTTLSRDNFTSDNLNINVTYLSEVQGLSTPALNSKNMNEISDDISSTKTTYHSITFDTSHVETSSVHSTSIDEKTTTIKKDNLTDVGHSTNEAFDISDDSISDINETIPDKTSVESTTPVKSSDIEANILTNTSKIITVPIDSYTTSDSTVSATSTEIYTKSGFITTEHITDNVPVIHSHTTDPVFTNDVLGSSCTKQPPSSAVITTESVILHHSVTMEPITTEDKFYENSQVTEGTIYTTTTKKPVTEITFQSTTSTNSKDIDTIPVSSIYERESSSSSSSTTTTTTTTTDDHFPYTVNETHREGKHIPFSSTLVRRTTYHPTIFNVTARTHSYPPQTDTTEHDLVNLRYNQIKAEELTPEERTNLINAVVKFSDRHYSNEELVERMAVIHLWLLHAIADEYKNATLNLSATNVTKSDEIEFENLPQILYVLPSPEVFLPNVSFTFVVHNKWRNETYPADIILTILNLHAENLKKILVDIEEISFSQGLLVQKHGLMAVIIEKYGIILLSTCLITVGIIFLLICVVVYYRKKTRHSAHCLTDDKMHRNMQEAMGIDLNPAVIILQEEIREKSALNGNKVCSLDGDEGWLAPINDVPVEDNNAPFVQDTKL